MTNHPVKRFKVGYLSATIWENERPSGDGRWYSIELTRAYKNGHDEIQNTNSLNAADLETARYLLRQASDWIVQQ